MERKKALNRFWGQHGIIEAAIGIKLLYEYARTRKETICREIYESMQELAAKTAGIQRNGEKGEILCIAISTLRSEILHKTGKIRMYAFDNRFYLDEEPVFVECDGSEIFQFIWKLEERLNQKAKYFRGNVLESDIRSFVLHDYTKFVNKLIIEIARQTIKEYGMVWISPIQKTADFRIIAGEYKGSLDELYLTEIVEKDSDTIRLEFQEYRKLPDELFCKNYVNCQLGHLDLKEINLSKSTFTNTDMSHDDFSDSFCMKTKWSSCNLTGTKWRNAVLLDADFSGCDLTDSDFRDSFAPISIPSILNLSIISWIGADFTNTILKNTTFKGANLAGADFRDAVFENTDFTGTDLYHAVFSPEARDGLQFSEEQLENILFQKGR